VTEAQRAALKAAYNAISPVADTVDGPAKAALVEALDRLRVAIQADYLENAARGISNPDKFGWREGDVIFHDDGRGKP